MTETSVKRNSITSNLGDCLRESMSNAKRVDIISSFVQMGGVTYLEPVLRKLRNRDVPIRLLTGTYLQITNPHALERLRMVCGDCITIKFYRETFEIKLSPYAIDEAAENLKKMDDLIRNDPSGRPPEFLAVICGMSSAAYRREDGVYVIPITSLGP